MLREIRTIPLEDVPLLNPAANFTCCFCQEGLVIYPEPTDTEASYRHNTVARHVRKRHRKIFEKRKNRGIWIKPIYRRKPNDLIADSVATDGQ